MESLAKSLSDLRRAEMEIILLESAKVAPAFETYARNMLATQFYAINKWRERQGLPPLEMPSEAVAE